MIKECLIFVTGAAAGAGTVWFIMNKKLKEEMASREEKIQKAIDQVKKAYSNSEKNMELKKNKTLTAKEIEEDLKKAKEIAKPYNIFSDEKEDPEFEHQFLTYVRKDDAVIWNDSLTIVDDPEYFLGEDFREQFEDGDDSISFQNNDDGVIYEVDLDEDNTIADLVGEAVDSDILAMAEGGV